MFSSFERFATIIDGAVSPDGATFSFPSLRSGKENVDEKKSLAKPFLLVNLFLGEP